jgi:putative hydroxymethylpyrimidine transport system ATP-binding protein
MTGPAVQVRGRASIGGTGIFGPLDLTIRGGRWTCLLGPSGVGKSTLLRLVAGLDEGVSFDGAVTADDGAPVAPRVAMMAQSGLLMPWLDVLGNVTLGARLRRARPDTDRARGIIARVGLEGHIAKKPGALSGGQRQRVALARTLMEDRPVVLLDEPFSALDARNRAAMQDLAAELLAGRTVLLVTHDAAEAARMGDAIVAMTETGLQHIDPPEGPAIRDFDAAAVLACQGRLLRLLRHAAA